MAYWRMRNPDSFQALFHVALRKGICADYLLYEHQSEDALRGMQRQWQLFLFCLRHHPLHPLHKASMKYKCRVRISHHDLSGMWQMHLTTQFKSIFSDVEEMPACLGGND